MSFEETMTPGPGFGPGGAAGSSRDRWSRGAPSGASPADAGHAQGSGGVPSPAAPGSGDERAQQAAAGSGAPGGGPSPGDGSGGPASRGSDAGGAREAAAETQADAVESELDALVAKAAKADEYLALAQRTKADFENYRKRATRDAAAAQERGAIRLALELLPAIDNLERALAHADSENGGESPGDDSFVAGIRHVHADVIAALARAGIESYSPDGEPFDPQLHEAVAQQPIEGAEPGSIVEVYQRGYRVGESVVRPARVVVAG